MNDNAESCGRKKSRAEVLLDDVADHDRLVATEQLAVHEVARSRDEGEQRAGEDAGQR